jgi:hypothetical protein
MRSGRREQTTVAARPVSWATSRNAFDVKAQPTHVSVSLPEIRKPLSKSGYGNSERDSDPDLSHTCSTEFTAEVETVKLGLQRARPRQRLRLQRQRDVVDPRTNKPHTKNVYPAATGDQRKHTESSTTQCANDELDAYQPTPPQAS